MGLTALLPSEGSRSSIPDRGKGFFSYTLMSRPVLRPTQPSIQWVPGSFPGAKARPGLDADPSPHLVPRSRMSRNYISSTFCRLHGSSGTALLTEVHVFVCRYPLQITMSITVLTCQDTWLVLKLKRFVENGPRLSYGFGLLLSLIHCRWC
jgi:hypothetical protein